MITCVALQKTSLIDFPGRVAAVVFTSGCNFRCPYCHNSELVFGKRVEGMVQIGELLGFLDKRRDVLSGIVLSGGEPLIHADLARVAEAVRKRGLSVKLDTNGSFPDRIAEIKPDYVALDIKTSPDEYSRVAPSMPDAGKRMLESLAVLRTLKIPFEIRITCAPGIVGPAEIRSIALLLERQDTVVLQDFRPFKTLDPAWTKVEQYSPGIMAELLSIVHARAPYALVRGDRVKPAMV